MSKDHPPCSTGCGQPATAPGAYLCAGCITKLERDLGDIAKGLLDDLEASYLRQTRSGSGDRGGSRSAETALPWDDRASSSTADAVRNAVVTWTRIVIEQAIEPPVTAYLSTAERDRLEAIIARRHARAAVILGAMDDARRLVMLPASVDACGRLLLEHLQWLARQPFAGDAFAELHPAVGKVIHVVDLPPASSFAGLCPGGWPDAEACATPLYGGTKTNRFTCPACGLAWNATQLRPYYEAIARDWLATAVEISRSLRRITGAGADSTEEPITAERIRKWKQRGRLQVRGFRGDQPLYRVGDVMERLDEDAAAAARREAKKERAAG